MQPPELTATSLASEAVEPLSENVLVLEWLANLDNPKTKKAYQRDIKDFLLVCGIQLADGLEQVSRGEVIAWRTHLEGRGLSTASIRRKLAALSSLFAYLCERQAVPYNPTQGVKRPRHYANEGKTPAISDAQAKLLLEAPPENTLKGKRDRAILAVLLYHGLRREELCRLTVQDLQDRQGVRHLRITGKRQKVRYLPVHPEAQCLVQAYLEQAGHSDDKTGPLFRPLRNPTTGNLRRHLHPDSILKAIVQHYAKPIAALQHVAGFCAHSLRTTAATNALANGADIAKVQNWLGHANIATTRLYDRRDTILEDSPTFRVSYD